MARTHGILYKILGSQSTKHFQSGTNVKVLVCHPLKHFFEIHSLFTGPSLPLSTLRLLVPPIRLVSAAIWQTVEQKIVSDYGLLEEFVFMVTEIVPQLLSTRQRAELILGLRARVRKGCSSFSKPLKKGEGLPLSTGEWVCKRHRTNSA